MAVWPESFCPLINSYQEQTPDNTIRTSMEVGPAKVRRRTTANVRNISFKMRLTKAQIATLDAFYQTDTFGGVDPFDFIHPRTGASVEARFVSPPSYNDIAAGYYDTDISLEILP